MPSTPDDVSHFCGPQSFGDYELLQELGRGGMGVVYRAFQHSLQRMVAVKMIRDEWLASPQTVRRFEQEARAAARLDHPGIVTVFEVGEYAGRRFFSMQLVEGESLADKLASGTFPAREAAACVQKVAEAIAYAHQHRIIHRDLKPANVLIDQHGTPKITDLGLARQLDRDPGQTMTTEFVGTVGYSSPEQAGSGAPVTEATDIYGLGALLYALLTGYPPFRSYAPALTLQMVLKHDPVALRKIDKRIPIDIETICLKCLQKDPGDRYASALELADDLGRFLQDRPIVAKRPSWLRRVSLACRRRPLAVVASVLAVLLFVSLAVRSATKSARLMHVPAARAVAVDEPMRESLRKFVQAQLVDHPPNAASIDNTSGELLDSLYRCSGLCLLAEWSQDYETSIRCAQTAASLLEIPTAADHFDPDSLELIRGYLGCHEWAAQRELGRADPIGHEWNVFRERMERTLSVQRTPATRELWTALESKFTNLKLRMAADNYDLAAIAQAGANLEAPDSGPYDASLSELDLDEIIERLHECAGESTNIAEPDEILAITRRLRVICQGYRLVAKSALEVDMIKRIDWPREPRILFWMATVFAKEPIWIQPN